MLRIIAAADKWKVLHSVLFVYLLLMGQSEIYETIKRTISSFLPDARVLLFGSHARGDNNRHSDYDLLVITPNELTKKERIDLTVTLDKSLVRILHAPFDILVYSEDEVNRKQVLPCHIIGTAIKAVVEL